MDDTSAAPVNRITSIRNDHPRLRIPRGAVARLVRVLDAHADGFLGGCPPGELSIAFLTDAALARIHADFMDDPTPTDVITFSGNPAGVSARPPADLTPSAGEVCISVDAAVRFAVLTPPRRRTVRAAARTAVAAELTLYLVHGWLHLAGYDDRESADRRRMRAGERRALDLLRRAGAVPVFRLI